MFSVFKNKEEKQALRERVKEIRAHFTGEEIAKANAKYKPVFFFFPIFNRQRAFFAMSVWTMNRAPEKFCRQPLAAGREYMFLGVFREKRESWRLWRFMLGRIWKGELWGF